MAWGRFRRRRAWQPDSDQVLPITPPAACPQADEEEVVSGQLPVVSDQKIEQQGPKPNFGMDYRPRPGAPEKYSVNGEEITAPEGLRLVEGPGERVPDDAAWVRVSLIGSPAETKPVQDDLDKSHELAGVKDRCVVQVYDPANPKTAWAVTRYGFVTDGHPSIYVQAPSGQVLGRLDHYPGPQVLAPMLVQAQRKVDPTYDPKKDPDPTKPPAGGLPPVPVLLIGGGIAAALLLKKQ